MAFINESHIEEADIQFFELVLGYEHINAWQKKLIGRKNQKVWYWEFFYDIRDL